MTAGIPRRAATCRPPRFFEFVANNRHLNWSSELTWNPTAHEAASEVSNFTGDQLPGDRNAHMTFQPVLWSPDDISWYGGTFGTPAGTYFRGYPAGSYPDRTGSDQLGVIDGSNFETWDARCP
jgi:hypothetical protein